MSNEPQFQEIVALYSMISRMRVLSSQEIVASAEKIMLTTIATLFALNETIRELHELIKSETDRRSAGDFTEIAREQLRTLPEL